MKNSAILKQRKPWIDNHNDIWLASVLNLYRNIEKFKFPEKMSPERRGQVIPLLTKELLNASTLSNLNIIKAEEMTPLEKEFLVEHFMSTQNYQQAYAGEAFLLDDSGQFMATINVDDHLQMHLIDTKGELEGSWNRLVKTELLIGKGISYAFNPRFGFLTADPNACGTALKISIYLQPSALIHTDKIDDILDQYLDKNLMVTGLQGSPTEVIGDVLKVENNYTLGVNEESIVSSLRTFTTKLIVEESSARSKIKQEDNTEIKDKISRAYGVLMHSYNIDAIEALNAISLLKLGSELGWLEGTTTAKLNELFFNCRRAHLLRHFGDEKISTEVLPHKRAEFIHGILKNVQLVI